MLFIVLFTVLSFLIAQSFRFLKYYQSRFFSLVFLSFISYLLAHFVSFHTAFYVSLLLLCVVSVVSISRNGLFIDKKAEGVFLASFAYFIFLRSLIPDIFGAEKLMDVAFINTVLRAESFPPPDPFFAGGVLDCYYYFGYVVGAVITLLSFSPPEIGFNIAIAAIAAYSFMLVYGLLKDIVSERAALLGMAFVLFSGNLYAVYELVADIVTLHPPSFLYYWNATRVIDGTINEFPYFSFIHADFHAHVVAIPLKILAVSFLYGIWRGKNIKPYSLSMVIISAVVYLTNSWDAPILLFLIACVALKRKDLALPIACVAATVLASTTIHSASAMIVEAGAKTSLDEFLLFFSIPFAFAYYYLREERKVMLFSLPLALFTSLFVPIAISVLPLVAAAAKRCRKDFFALLVLTGCVTVLIPEFVAVESRLNTVFKFYLVAWILLTIPGAVALYDIFRNLRGEPVEGGEKSRLAIFMLALFAMSFVYPVVATPIRYCKAEMTLDGMAFTKAYGEYDAIKWLRGKKGIIAEAASECYTYGGRFAALTGNPTIVGWACHEVQWRGNGEELAKRIADLRTVYTKPSVELLKKYNVRYVVVGYEERREYRATPEIFEEMVKKGLLKRAYEDRGVVIFAVKEAAKLQ